MAMDLRRHGKMDCNEESASTSTIALCQTNISEKLDTHIANKLG